MSSSQGTFSGLLRPLPFQISGADNTGAEFYSLTSVRYIPFIAAILVIRAATKSP